MNRICFLSASLTNCVTRRHGADNFPRLLGKDLLAACSLSLLRCKAQLNKRVYIWNLPMKAFGFCRGSAGKTPQKNKANKSIILFIHSSETWTLRSSGLNNLCSEEKHFIYGVTHVVAGSQLNNYKTTLENTFKLNLWCLVKYYAWFKNKDCFLVVHNRPKWDTHTNFIPWLWRAN